MTLGELQAQTQNNKQEGKVPSYKKLTGQNLTVVLQFNTENQKLVVYENGLATYSDMVGDKIHHTVYSIFNLTLFHEYSRNFYEPIKISDYPEFMKCDAEKILIFCGQSRLDQNTYSRETDNEIKMAKKKNERIKKTGKHLKKSISSDDGFSEDLINSIEPNEHEKQLQMLRQAFKKLTKKQKEVIKLIYWKNLTQEDTAKKLGISRASVQNRLDGALKKLKKYMTQ